MGRKIFVSYKYADDSVANLEDAQNSTVRDYVTEFEELIEETDHIFKGESDGEDLSQLDEETIWEKLRDRIYDSSITVVFISPNMKETGKSERDQWIPWEISYSLKETSRRDKNGKPVSSKTNAMLGVVLPDINGSYSYFLEPKDCCNPGCVAYHTGKLFEIHRRNMFNMKNPNKRECDAGELVYSGEPSYIEAVKWSDFITDYESHFDAAYARRDNVDDYEIVKTLS
jgi:hypothetical protein